MGVTWCSAHVEHPDLAVSTGKSFEKKSGGDLRGCGSKG
jgi:hypothetical protein